MRLLKALLIAGLTLVALYYIGVNALLASPLPMSWANRDPEHLQLKYRRAYTWVPGKLVMTGFELSLQDPLTQVAMHADRVSGDIAVFALPQQRFKATGVIASGVTFRLRQRTNGAPANPTFLPAIAGFGSVERIPNDPWPTLIELNLVDMHLSDVREIWVDEWRYRGRAVIDGTLEFDPLRSLALRDLVLRDVDAALTRGPRAITVLASVSAEATLERINLANVDAADFSKLTGHVSMVGRLEAKRVLNAALRSVPSVYVEGDDGPTSAEVNVVHGVLQDGSNFTASTEALAVQSHFGSVGGAATATASVDGGVRTLQLTMTPATVIGPKGQKWFLAREVQLTSTGSADLTAPPAERTTLRLHDGNASTLQFINHFIPPELGLSLVGGRGAVSLWVELSTESMRGSGAVRITGHGVQLRNRASRVEGDLEVKVALKSFNLTTGAIRFDGSSVSVTNARVFADQTQYPDFSAVIVANPCTLAPNTALPWSATLALSLERLQPVLGLLSEQARLPWTVRAIAEHQNVSATVELAVRSHRVTLTNLRVSAKKLSVLGQVTLVETPATQASASSFKATGAVLVRSPPVLLAVQLNGETVTPVLLDADAWYRKWQTANAP